MGKIFNALEKYRSERRLTGYAEKIRSSDYDILLRYDRATGRLDIGNPEIVSDAGAAKRLVTYGLIKSDGRLTPAGLARCAELVPPEQEQGRSVQAAPAPQQEAAPPAAKKPAPPEKKAAKSTKSGALSTRPQPASAAAAAVGDHEKPVSAPAVKARLQPEDWQALMQYDRASGKLDISDPAIITDPGTVRRLLDNGLIVYGGKLTRQGLAECKERSSGSGRADIQTAKDAAREKSTRSVLAEPVGPAEPRAVAKAPEKHFVLGKSFTEDLPGEGQAGRKAGFDGKVAARAGNKKRPPAGLAGAKAPAAVPIAVPDSKAMDENLVSLRNPQSFEAEQFKILRTNLLFPVAGKSPRSIMVTSALPGEGKSFVSANLAVSIALHVNKHVLLLDCDLRRPSIHRWFGFNNVAGLSDYLARDVPLQPLLLKTGIERLSILPGGRPPDNPSELLSSTRMSELIREVSERYPDRLVILDSPPPRLTAESGALARQVDGVILVIKYGKTRRDAAKELVEKLGPDKILGAIINSFDVRSSRYYHKYYGK